MQPIDPSRPAIPTHGTEAMTTKRESTPKQPNPTKKPTGELTPEGAATLAAHLAYLEARERWRKELRASEASGVAVFALEDAAICSSAVMLAATELAESAETMLTVAVVTDRTLRQGVADARSHLAREDARAGRARERMKEAFGMYESARARFEGVSLATARDVKGTRELAGQLRKFAERRKARSARPEK